MFTNTKTASLVATFAASLLLALLVGCVSPKRADQVAEAQAQAAASLAESYATDLAMLRRLTVALFDIRSESLRSRIERQIVRRYLTPSGEANLDALDADLNNAPNDNDPPSPLIAAVNTGEMTAAEARDWLARYAQAWRSDADAPSRHALLETLPPIRRQRDARQALLERLDAHAQRIRRLIEDALASAEALQRFTSLQAELADPSRQSLARLWQARVLESVDSPARRQLLDDFFEIAFPDALPETPNTEPSDEHQ